MLLNEGIEEIEAWASVYVCHKDGKTCAIVVYVDDLLILGDSFADELITRVRKEIEMEEPIAVNRYLGCCHEVHTVVREKFVNSTYDFVMSDYFRAACEDYEKETGQKLVNNHNTPAPPAIDNKALDLLLATPGERANDAPHFLMKLLYGARIPAVPG